MRHCNSGCCNQDDSDEFDVSDETFNEFDGEEENTIPCPYCGIDIYDDAEVCPHCRSYIVDEDRPSLPMWVIGTALLLLALILSGFTCLL